MSLVEILIFQIMTGCAFSFYSSEKLYLTSNIQGQPQFSVNYRQIINIIIIKFWIYHTGCSQKGGMQ